MRYLFKKISFKRFINIYFCWIVLLQHFYLNLKTKILSWLINYGLIWMGKIKPFKYYYTTVFYLVLFYGQITTHTHKDLYEQKWQNFIWHWRRVTESWKENRKQYSEQTQSLSHPKFSIKMVFNRWFLMCFNVVKGRQIKN